MTKTDSGNSEKTLISRRTLLSNSLLTGLSIAAGFYLTNPSNFPAIRSDLKNGGNSDLANSGKKSKEKTYIDNFDC
jgi:hypothetical protein